MPPIRHSTTGPLPTFHELRGLPDSLPYPLVDVSSMTKYRFPPLPPPLFPPLPLRETTPCFHDPHPPRPPLHPSSPLNSCPRPFARQHLASTTLTPSPSSLPPSRPGLLRAAGADRGRGLHADVLRVFSDISADPDPGAHHPGSRAPGVFGDVSRGYPLREDHGLPSGLHRPLAVWLRRCCQVTFRTRRRINGSSVSCGVVFDAAGVLPLWASWWCYRSLWPVAPDRFCEPKTMSQPDTRALSWARAESKWFVALTVFDQVGCFFRSYVSSRSYVVGCFVGFALSGLLFFAFFFCVEPCSLDSCRLLLEAGCVCACYSEVPRGAGRRIADS